LHILQVHCEYQRSGGEEAVVEAEARVLQDAGHVVSRYSVSNEERFASVRFLASPWNPIAARKLRAEILRISPDIVHIHNTWFSLGPSSIGVPRALGVPSVLTLHNYRMECANALLLRDGKPCELCVGSSPLSGIRYRCFRKSYAASTVAAATVAVHKGSSSLSKPDRIVLLTQFAKDRLARSLPDSRVVIKPNFTTDPGPRPTPPSDSENVLFVGRLSAEKGISDLVDSWRSVGSSLQLRIAGDGPLDAEMRARLPKSSDFLGRLDREKLQHEMFNARALIFPSRWYEGMPMVLLEAMASGLAIAWRDIGGITDVVGSDPSDLTFGVHGSMEMAIRRLDSDDLVDRAGEQNRRTYEARYSPIEGLRNLEALYGSVAGSESS